MRFPTLLVVLFVAYGCSSGETPPVDTAAEMSAVAEGAAGEAVSHGHDMEAGGEQALLHRPDPAGTYGAGIQVEEVSSIAAILEQPETYEGKVVHISGEVAEVCPRRGCWIEVTDAASGRSIRVKVKDGDIVFPLSAEGESIDVEGTVEKIEMDEEQARSWKQHEADERGEDFDPASVTGPMVVWRIRGAGAEIKG